MAFRLGIIGAGGISEFHADAAIRAGQSIAGFCDVDAGRAARRAARRAAKYADHGTIATTSLDELLALPDMPAVVIATPNYRHKDIAIAALAAHKDVLLEKPMALNVAECDQIIAAAGRTRQIVQMGFVSRCSPASLAARQLIEAGRLGSIYHVKAAIYRRRGIPGLGRWFTDKSQSGGGVLIDLGVHLIDLALHLTGRPKAVRVSAACTSMFGQPIEQYVFNQMWAGPPNTGGVFDVEDAATALVRFDTGMTMELNVMWAANVPESAVPGGMTILGDQAGINFDVFTNKLTLASQQDGRLIDVSPQLGDADPTQFAWQRQHELFARAVNERAQPHATIEHGRVVQAVIDAMYRSSQESREVEIASPRMA